MVAAKTAAPTEASSGKPPIDSTSGHANAAGDAPAHKNDAVGVDPDANQPDKLSSESQAAPPAGAPGPLRLTGLRLGKPAPVMESKPEDTGSGGEVSGSVQGPPAGIPHPLDDSGPAANGNQGGVSASTGLSLVDVAGLDSDSGQGIELAGIDPEDDTGYLDEVPATAPERELPEELDATQQAFIKSLDSIYSLKDDPDMFVDVVRRIMSEMQDRPELAVLLAPEDSGAMIRGLRQQAGMAQVKKQAAKDKRGKKAAKPNSEAVDSALQSLQGLAGLGADGSFD